MNTNWHQCLALSITSGFIIFLQTFLNLLVFLYSVLLLYSQGEKIFAFPKKANSSVEKWTKGTFS